MENHEIEGYNSLKFLNSELDVDVRLAKYGTTNVCVCVFF